LDAARRQLVKVNHTSTHLVNHALREILGDAIDQRGSLVLPEKLRFDFSWNKALTGEQLQRVDELVRREIEAALPVHSQEVPLRQALAIRGLRAVAGEQYPNCVRVLSVGVAVNDLLAAPDRAEWRSHSVELCGGTHISNTSEVRRFTMISEEPLALGIRRLTAVTGQLAEEAEANADALEKKVAGLEPVQGEELKAAITQIGSEVDKASIPAHRRVALRALLEKHKARVIGDFHSVRTQQAEAARQHAEKAIETLAGSPSNIHVGVVQAGSFTTAMVDSAKSIQARHPEVAVLLLSPEIASDAAKSKVTVVAQVPECLVARGLNAGEWARTIAAFLGGKGGGKPTTAQGSGPNVGRIDEAVGEARAFAQGKLGGK